MKTETHPLKWIVPEGAKTLICGTFPPVRSRWSYEFFYPNKRNHLWPVLAAVAGKTLQHFEGQPAVEERKQLLKHLKTGITDMGHTIKRLVDNSADENLAIVEYMNILQLLLDHPSIEKILFTSSSGKVSAVGWFAGYAKQVGWQYKFLKTARPWKAEFLLEDRIIQLRVLYSPSPRAANRISREKLVELYSNEIIGV